MLAGCGCFEKAKKFLEMIICVAKGQVIYAAYRKLFWDKWRSIWSVETLFPPVALRFPLRLDKSSQKQLKSAGARVFRTAKTHRWAFLK